MQELAEKRAAKILGKTKPKFYEQKDGVEFVSREGWTSKKKASKNASLAELLEREKEDGEFKQTKNGVHEVPKFEIFLKNKKYFAVYISVKL